MSAAPTDPDPVRDWPLWWFASLEAAIDRDNRKKAAQSLRELKRLGFTIKYGGRRDAQKDVAGNGDFEAGQKTGT